MEIHQLSYIIFSVFRLVLIIQESMNKLFFFLIAAKLRHRIFFSSYKCDFDDLLGVDKKNAFLLFLFNPKKNGKKINFQNAFLSEFHNEGNFCAERRELRKIPSCATFTRFFKYINS